jgi:hypothetical protein
LEDGSVLKSLYEIPPAARLLGFSGLIPFVAAAAGALIADSALQDMSLRALVAYGAVILSFLGGVRWGLAIAQTDATALWKPLVISVLPSLLGWAALLLPTGTGLLILATGLATMLIADARLPEAPQWYRSLRIPLSLGAIGALIAGMTV